MKALQTSNQESKAAANQHTNAIQAKLTIGKPEDAFEQEADAVAERVISGEANIQRKCAACKDEHKLQRQPEEEEEDLQMKPLVQRKTTTQNGITTTPWIEQQIRSNQGGGRPLPDETRSFMENGIGANFQNVKVHTDKTSVQMNRELGARAFTVGNDIFFNSGQYSPDTTDGKKLLAHELTHTLQQGASDAKVQRHALAFSQDMDEEMIQKTEEEEVESSPAAGTQQQTNPSCSHNASGLTWADFQGSVPSGSSFGAATHFNFTTTQVNGSDVIVANFLPANSWVKTPFKQAGQRNHNGCTPPITACEEFMQAEADAGRTGATYNLSQPTGCAASIGPDPNATAHNKGECESVLGTECDRVALLESARLLRHEQYHFGLACVLAQKGTTAIAGGANTQTTLSSVRSIANTKTTEYDNQTVHGCNASQQAAWQTAIDNGLPNTSV